MAQGTGAALQRGQRAGAMLCVPPFAERVQVELEVGAGDDRCDPRAMLLAAAPALEEVRSKFLLVCAPLPCWASRGILGR